MTTTTKTQSIERQIAAKLQENVLPIPAIPESEDWKLCVKRQNADQVQGDYLDVIKFIDGTLLMVTVDVMGKGFPATVIATITRTALHMHIKRPYTMLDLIHSVNDMLCYQLGEFAMFAGIGLVQISSDRKSLQAVNAGLSPIMYLDHTDQMSTIEPSGPPIGLFPEAAYRVEELPLLGAEKLIMLTDGNFSWKQAGLPWGWEGFSKFLNPAHFADPERLWSELGDKMAQADPSDEDTDDRSLLCWELINT